MRTPLRGLALLLVTFGAGEALWSPRPGAPAFTLDTLRANGRLRLALVPGAPSYYLDRGHPAGFEYDLLEGFAESLDVKLRPIAVDDAWAARRQLRLGRVDLAVLPYQDWNVAGARRGVRYLIHTNRPDERRSALPRTGAVFVRGDSPGLLVELNRYLHKSRHDGTVKLLYDRYLRSENGPVPSLAVISEYDTLVAKHARESKLDWRLVAAVIAAESRFDPKAVSHRGARGLMQIMPFLTDEPGRLRDPETNVDIGVRYLRRLLDRFRKPDGSENPALALAAYVMGPGHLQDARRLAREMGKDPDEWSGEVENVIPLLELPEYHERTRHGFARGREAVAYVNQVLDLYTVYLGTTPEDVELAFDEVDANGIAP